MYGKVGSWYIAGEGCRTDYAASEPDHEDPVQTSPLKISFNYIQSYIWNNIPLGITYGGCFLYFFFSTVAVNECTSASKM